MRAFIPVLLSGLILLATVRQAQAQSIPPDLDNLIKRVMKTFQVPGLSVVIVKDGEVLVTRGYGVRELGKPQKVDEKTLFPIASVSKGFTAAALGILVDRGKIGWDDPVIDYLPGFRLSDPYVTTQLTIRDLLVHRSGLGLGAGDLLFWPPTSHSRKELVRRLRFVPLSTSFRSAYAYDNVLYPVAGEVIEVVSGQTWETFVDTEILDRLGMKRSLVSSSDLFREENHARPHALLGDTVEAVEPMPLDNANPAGGISSCAEEMARWQLALLNEGKLHDRSSLITRQTAAELWKMVTPIPVQKPQPELAELKYNFHGYALGFHVMDYRGRKLVWHTGGLVGYRSISGMLPELGLGVVVLTNQESGAAARAILYSVFDHYLKAPKKDWLGAFHQAEIRSAASFKQAEKRIDQTRDRDSRPSLPLERYASTYADRWYGDITITHREGKLGIRFEHTPLLVGDLVHWQHDTFVARWKSRDLRADAFVTFALNPDGSIERAKMKPVSPATDFSFDFHDLLLVPVKKER